MSRKNAPANSGKWTTGLFGCLTDMESCARNYVLLSNSTLVGCCFYSCSYRSKLRHMFKLHASPCGCPDCMVHFCCEPCALCQEYRELKNRGFNLALGWDHNKEARANLNLDLNVNIEAQYITPDQTNPVPPQQMNQDDYQHY